MKKYTKAAAARHLQVTRRTVYNLLKKGTLVADENGLIALDEDADVVHGEHHAQSIQSVYQSSPRLKDKYIAHLEAEVAFLREELRRLRRERRQRESPFDSHQTDNEKSHTVYRPKKKPL